MTEWFQMAPLSKENTHNILGFRWQDMELEWVSEETMVGVYVIGLCSTDAVGRAILAGLASESERSDCPSRLSTRVEINY